MHLEAYFISLPRVKRISFSGNTSKSSWVDSCLGHDLRERSHGCWYYSLYILCYFWYVLYVLFNNILLLIGVLGREVTDFFNGVYWLLKILVTLQAKYERCSGIIFFMLIEVTIFKLNPFCKYWVYWLKYYWKPNIKITRYCTLFFISI